MEERLVETELARLMSLLSHKNRIALLEGIDAGKAPNEIAEERGVSRQTLQGHIDKLKDGNLIERNGDESPYQLTNIGAALLTKSREIEAEIVAESLRESGDDLTADIRDSLEELRQLEDADIGFESPFSPEEWAELAKQAETEEQESRENDEKR